MKIKHYLLGAAATLFAVAANSQEPAVADSNAQESVVAVDSNFYIFLCFGQSNMEGQGAISVQDKNVDERFLAMRTTDCDGELYSWRKAVPPLARCGVGLGPVDYFGRLLIDSLAPHNPNIRIGVVDVAVAGCDIQLFETANDADLEYQKKVDSWMKPMIEAYGGRPYLRLVEAAKEAQKVGVIKGILLHQGETNTGQSTWPGRVAAIYDNLISQLNLNAEDVPLLVGEVGQTDLGGQCGSHNSVIAKVPDVIPNSFVVSSKNLDLNSDGLHFTPASYRAFGKRYAKQMLRFLGYTIETLPPISIDTTIVVNCKDKYTWTVNNTKYTESKKVSQTITTENDQDSTINLTLVINKSAKTQLDPVTVEKEYTWPVDGKTYTESQILTFKGKTVNGCDSIVTCELTVSGATAIGDVPANEKITLYPNPAVDVLNISVPSCAVGEGKIVIYTAAGIEVFSANFVSELETIDVSTWNNDIYIVQITDADGNLWTGKFVKFD